MRMAAFLPIVFFYAATTLADSAATSPTTQPVTRPIANRVDQTAKNPAIVTAALELSKELLAADEQSLPPPRVKSDYFAASSSEIPPKAVLAALSKSHSADPRVQAYVKWQLLSALKHVEDEKVQLGLLRAYASAPAPIERPTVSAKFRQQLDRLARGKDREDEMELAEQFSDSMEQIERANLPIFAYRDELFRRLHPSYDCLLAGFDDALQRLGAGWNPQEHMEAVIDAAMLWAADNPPPQQMQALLSAVVKLKYQDGPEYYDGIEWSERYRRLAWKKRRLPDLNYDHQLDELKDYLEERIRNPVKPLKFKDE